MSSLSMTLAIIVVASFIVLQCTSQPPSMDEPNDEEKKICEESAEERGTNLKEAKKDRPRSCKVICRYVDGTESTENSPDGQLCCDVVGGLPTGRCDNGACPPGGVS